MFLRKVLMTSKNVKIHLQKISVCFQSSKKGKDTANACSTKKIVRRREDESRRREEDSRRREEDLRRREIDRCKNQKRSLATRAREASFERAKLEREKVEIIRLERERQKLEREKLELEKLELQRDKVRLQAEDLRGVKRSGSYRREDYGEKKKSSSDRRYEEAFRKCDLILRERLGFSLQRSGTGSEPSLHSKTGRKGPSIYD
ncbi:hypothetical protein FQR65_LT03507 [Abscondita terminalis]|nr:hypothetical protein FQR65_LT03507 [Abscondita terminalis]